MSNTGGLKSINENRLNNKKIGNIYFNILIHGTVEEYRHGVTVSWCLLDLNYGNSKRVV